MGFPESIGNQEGSKRRAINIKTSDSDINLGHHNRNNVRFFSIILSLFSNNFIFLNFVFNVFFLTTDILKIVQSKPQAITSNEQMIQLTTKNVSIE